MEKIFTKIRNLKKETIYLWMALVFGLLMALINPPFAGVPDEHAHFWKAWSVADGYLKCSGHDQIPKSAIGLPDAIKPVNTDAFQGKKIIVKKLEQFLAAKDSDYTRGDIGGANCPATPFGYVPQALSLRIGEFFNLSALANVYFARIITLLASILLVYWAIKTVPYGKMIFLLIALLPLTIRQFSSLSYDGLQIGFAMLFLAYILKFAFEKDKALTKKDTYLLLALSLFGLNIKAGYFALAFLIFLLPQSKFKTKKTYWWTLGGFAALNVIFFLILHYTFVDIAVPNWTDPAAQLRYVLSNPFNFLYIAFGSFYDARGFLPFMESIFFKAGTGDSLAYWLYILMFAGFIIFLKNSDEEVPLSTRQRTIMFLVFLANFLLIYLALYVGWTSVGAEHVSGVQGRYFLVILPLLLFTFYKAKLRFSFDFIKKYYNLIFLVFLLITFVASFLVIYQAYYQKIPKEQKAAAVQTEPDTATNVQ